MGTKPLKFGAAFLAAVLLAGCAAAPERPGPVPLAPGIALALPAPKDLGRSVDAMQIVTASYGEQVFVFEGRLAVDPAQLQLVGTDAMGRRVMTIRWTGERMESERAPFVPDTLRSENILADIALMYWPQTSVADRLSGKGVTVADYGGQRVVRRDGEAVIVIDHDADPWNGVTRLRNLAWNYEIEARSVTP